MQEKNADRPIHVIACGVLAADIRHVAREQGIPTTMEFLPGGLHERPRELRRRLQERIDRVSATFRGDRIVVGYGVCGLGTIGLFARNVPLAIPRVNDCIAMFLGSDAAYHEQFARHPGTYYISAGWVEEKTHPESSGASLIQCGPDCFTLSQLVRRYGEENAEAIREFVNSWQRNYQRAAYIETGVSDRGRDYAELASAMARKFGWTYEEVAGSHDLLNVLMTSDRSNDQVLVVPPHHVTAHDPINRVLQANPVWKPGTEQKNGRDFTLVFDGLDKGATGRASGVKRGLGIDAGGTYTDAVLYDFDRDEVVAVAKAPTTKWDFSVGISQVLDKLTMEHPADVDLVSISTTLATNAIVENRGQKVGLLLFPPYGRFYPADTTYRPIGILKGELEIDGVERKPVDERVVREQIRKMIEVEGVRAFAVSGYASHVNPIHEQQVKRIIETETEMDVTCAFEVSEEVGYVSRGITAMLNASIIPVLESFLEDSDRVLRERGISAPRMVVRSDGTLMSLAVARLRPIETVLSGPAASVAGAGYLARVANAMVIDMGGTTTDTAIIRDGRVRTRSGGTAIGNWAPRVASLDLRTLGLGGDSLISWNYRQGLTIGPVRVVPVAYALAHDDRVLDWLTANLDQFSRFAEGMSVAFATSARPQRQLTEAERRTLDALAEGPRCLDQLASAAGLGSWRYLPLDSLEQQNLIQRSALTPTDLLHATGRLHLWDTTAAERYCQLFCRLIGKSVEEFAKSMHREIVHRLATELLRKQLAETDSKQDFDGSPATVALVENWLEQRHGDFQVRIALRDPVVGVGAPIHLYLADVAELLETEAVIPRHASVANAIGAITSRVLVQTAVEISPSDTGGYRLAGLPGAPEFHQFQDAHDYAVIELQRLVRQRAAESGTSDMRVEILVHDRVAPTALGSELFIGRVLTARLSGRPDVARLSK
jgi:N-methylhydantoinase A/oxoprolinase/acetone carboxylase beta subunit